MAKKPVYIEAQDFLDEGRVKLNKGAIDTAYRAEVNSEGAVKQSEVATDLALDSIEKSEQTSSEVQNMIKEQDLNPNKDLEIVQSRGEYPVLADRLKNVDYEMDTIGINAVNYGFVGDGVTDNSAVVKVLNTDKRVTSIIFPKGNYLTKEMITKKASGRDATILFSYISETSQAVLTYPIVLSEIPLEVGNQWQRTVQLNNTSVGVNAGIVASDLSYGNTTFGNNALQYLTKDIIKNIAMGNNAGRYLGNAYQNLIIGVDAAANAEMGERNVILGNNACLYTGTNNLENHLFYRTVTGEESTAILNLNKIFPDWRAYAGEIGNPKITISNRAEFRGNTFVGRNAGGWTIKPQFNVGIGYNSLEKALEGLRNVALGVNSMHNSLIASDSIAIGFDANANNARTDSDISIGSGSMKDVPNSEFNISVGFQALRGMLIDPSSEEIESNNIAFGKFSQANKKAATKNNISLGENSLRYIDGNHNIGIGQNAGAKKGNRGVFIGASSGNKVVSGDDVIAIGYNALNAVYEGFNNIVGLGNNTSVTDSNQISLGNSQATPIAFNQLQVRSDERDKKNIVDGDLGLDFIKLLKPRKYQMDFREAYQDFSEVEGEDGEIIVVATDVERDGSRSGSRYHEGFIAQEVKAVMDDLGVDFAGFQHHAHNGGKDVMSLGYSEFIPVLVKGMQEQQVMIEKQQAMINQLIQKVGGIDE